MTSAALRFGPFEIDPGAHRLRRAGVALDLAPKAFDLLLLLIRRSGLLVTKDDMLAAVWPDVAVTDNALTQVISDLRQALGDSASKPAFIETVPRRGYRFVAEVSDVAESARSISLGSFAHLTGDRINPRETSSLDAYRALTEGRLKLETLDQTEIPAAIASFERALSLDDRYALAEVGLAHARFWQFQATRAHTHPDLDALTRAIAHAQRAIEIDPDLAEAHSALGFLLSAAERREEGTAACRRALAMEPGNWRHQFRLGMASWGPERLVWLDAVASQYPALSYAHFGRAMVHVARGALDLAEQVLRDGIAHERRSIDGAARFPASGLHWLLGLVRLAQGDAPGARVAFDRELQSPSGRMLSEEYACEAMTGHGFALLAGRDDAGACAMFERALETIPDFPRALIGLAAASHRLGSLIQKLGDGGRPGDAAIVTALGFANAGRSEEATPVLTRLLNSAPYGSTGWMLPIEPALAPLRRDPAFIALLAQLSARAR